MPNTPHHLPATRTARPPARLPAASTGPRRPPTDVIVNRSQHIVEAQLRKGQDAGVYGRSSAIVCRNGVYAVKVIRLKPAPPRWRKPALIGGGILAALTAVAGLLWWAIGAIVAAVAGLGPVALVVAALAVAGAAVGHQRIVEVWVRVRIRP